MSKALTSIQPYCYNKKIHAIYLILPTKKKKKKIKTREFPVPLERLAACLVAARAQSTPNHSISSSGDSYYQLLYTASEANTFNVVINRERQLCIIIITYIKKEKKAKNKV